jgi:hypothetical protein
MSDVSPPPTQLVYFQCWFGRDGMTQAMKETTLPDDVVSCIVAHMSPETLLEFACTHRNAHVLSQQRLDQLRAVFVPIVSTLYAIHEKTAPASLSTVPFISQPIVSTLLYAITHAERRWTQMQYIECLQTRLVDYLALRALGGKEIFWDKQFMTRDGENTPRIHCVVSILLPVYSSTTFNPDLSDQTLPPSVGNHWLAPYVQTHSKFDTYTLPASVYPHYSQQDYRGTHFMRMPDFDDDNDKRSPPARVERLKTKGVLNSVHSAARIVLRRQRHVRWKHTRRGEYRASSIDFHNVQLWIDFSLSIYEAARWIACSAHQCNSTDAMLEQKLGKVWLHSIKFPAAKSRAV